MGAGGSFIVKAEGETEKDALKNLHAKLFRKYGAKIRRDRNSNKLFVAANGAAHYVKIKTSKTGFTAYIVL